ncbi:radical SAM protein [Shewanella maritima]|uniref:Radical SAM protein n=2 Tax=Shewanella maritima TaxID=2520507 RepID=A0A411PMR2_9GAMM|nr:radical SAM protein [Shewanella maritima]
MRKEIVKSLNLDGVQLIESSFNRDFSSNTVVDTLYIHIPFCQTLCKYCSFFKVKFNEQLALAYFSALRKEIRFVIKSGLQFRKVYIGGGTTTILEEELVKTILLIKELVGDVEVSCESDPIYFSQGNPKSLVGLIDRMSIGVQSFDDQILKRTGRFEKFGCGHQLQDYIGIARNLFPNINIDFMFGFKGQTIDLVRNDMEIAIKLQAEQITTYPLSFGVGPLRRKEEELAGNNAALFTHFQAAKSTLTNSYSRELPWVYKNRTCTIEQSKYVLDGESCFGIGAGAFGRIKNQFNISTFSIGRYIELINSRGYGAFYKKNISDNAIAQHDLMMMLAHGKIDDELFQEHSGKSLSRALPLELTFLSLIGAVTKIEGGYETTKEGEFLAFKMFGGFLTGMNYLRSEARGLTFC